MKKISGLILLVFCMTFFVDCSKDESNERDLLSSLYENEFVFAEDGGAVILIINDCQYNQLKSVEVEGLKITVSKTFNSMMKLPCVLRCDTISLGDLTAGVYQLDYYLIDRNTFIEDSVSFHETRVLTVK